MVTIEVMVIAVAAMLELTSVEGYN